MRAGAGPSTASTSPIRVAVRGPAVARSEPSNQTPRAGSSGRQTSTLGFSDGAGRVTERFPPVTRITSSARSSGRPKPARSLADSPVAVTRLSCRVARLSSRFAQTAARSTRAVASASVPGSASRENVPAALPETPPPASQPCRAEKPSCGCGKAGNSPTAVNSIWPSPPTGKGGRLRAHMGAASPISARSSSHSCGAAPRASARPCRARSKLPSSLLRRAVSSARSRLRSKLA